MCTLGSLALPPGIISALPWPYFPPHISYTPSDSIRELGVVETCTLSMVGVLAACTLVGVLARLLTVRTVRTVTPVGVLARLLVSLLVSAFDCYWWCPSSVHAFDCFIKRCVWYLRSMGQRTGQVGGSKCCQPHEGRKRAVTNRRHKGRG